VGGHRRSVAGVLVAVLALVTGACSRDGEVEAVLGELDAFTQSLLGKVKAGATPQAGVDEAQKYLDASGPALSGKLASLKTVRGFQISAETKKKLEARFLANATAVAGLQIEYAMQAARDDGFRARLEKLANDYTNLVVG
jgi:hypothetical protein